MTIPIQNMNVTKYNNKPPFNYTYILIIIVVIGMYEKFRFLSKHTSKHGSRGSS